MKQEESYPMNIWAFSHARPAAASIMAAATVLILCAAVSLQEVCIERVGGSEFTLELRSAREVPVGEETSVQVLLKARKSWHINPVYPSSLVVTTGKGLSLHREQFSMKDAELSGRDELVFDVNMTPIRAGGHEIRMSLDFGLCEGRRCIVQTTAATISFAAGGKS